MESDLKLTVIDWGYCIPDCARCCQGQGKELTAEESVKIAIQLGVDNRNFIGLIEGNIEKKHGTANQHDNNHLRKRILLRTENGSCIFLCNNSLCLIYPYRPEVCRRYGSWQSDCRDYRRLQALETSGCKVAVKLKQMWLSEKSRKGYDRIRWRVKAELFIAGEAAKNSMASGI